MPSPIIDITQMRAWEAATWAAGKTEAEVIHCVGQKVAARALLLTQNGDRVLIVAGKGHNGDDARQAVPHLAGREAELFNVTDPAADLTALIQLLAPRPNLIIDGLFGIGLNRPLSEAWIRLLETINEAAVPVLAVDVPSGLDAGSGEPLGAAIRATVTLTLGAPKKGMLASRAWPFVGRLEVEPDIGLVACPCQSDLNWTLVEDFRGYPPLRAAASHKGTYGHVLVVAGSPGYHGAAVLAARGALSAQPGLVTVWTVSDVYVPVAAQLQAAMVHRWKPDLRPPESVTGWMIGPGLASEDVPSALKQRVSELWKTSPLPMVVDASALEWLPLAVTPAGVLRLITPHPGEAARLLKTTAAKVQEDRPAALRQLSASRGGCWVVLKGHQTVIGRSRGELFINSSGNPYMAQGGSGDVLAGFLGGLVCQPALQHDALLTMRYGVWRHGVAGDVLQATRRPWVVEELPDALRL